MTTLQNKIHYKCLEIVLQVFLKKSDTVEQRKRWSSLTPSAHVLQQTGPYTSKILNIKFCRIFICTPIFLQETSSSSSSKELNLPCAGFSDLADLGAKYWLLLIYQKNNISSPNWNKKSNCMNARINWMSKCKMDNWHTVLRFCY